MRAVSQYRSVSPKEKEGVADDLDTEESGKGELR